MENHAPARGVTQVWRLAIFVLASSIGVLAIRLALVPLSLRVGALRDAQFPAYAFAWTLAGGLLVGHAWTFRLAEPRGWSFVGLGRDAVRPRPVVTGLLLGALGIGIPSLLLLGLGWLRVEPAPGAGGSGVALRVALILLPASLGEELLTRGYFFAMLREARGAWPAVAVTSVLFGLLHLQNEGVTLQSMLLVILAGVFLGTVLVRTGSLYASWAAHFSWNYVMAGVMHASVSGIGLATPGYRVVDAGPDWATGGGWGPEGGLFAAAGMAAALIFLNRRRSRRQE